MHSQRYNTLKIHMKQLAMRYDMIHPVTMLYDTIHPCYDALRSDSPLLRCSAIRFTPVTMQYDAVRSDSPLLRCSV